MTKIKATQNKAKDVETKSRTEESILREQYGSLQLEREAYLARLENVERRMLQIKVQLQELLKEEKKKD